MFSFNSLAMNMVQVMSTQHYYRTWESFSIYLEPCTTNKNTSHFIHFILKNHNNKVYFCLWLFFFFFKWTPPFLTCFAVSVLYSVHWVHVNNASLNPWEIFNFLGKLLKRNIFHRIFFRKRNERVLFQHFHWKRYCGGLSFQFYSWTTLLCQNSNVSAVY